MMLRTSGALMSMALARACERDDTYFDVHTNSYIKRPQSNGLSTSLRAPIKDAPPAHDMPVPVGRKNISSGEDAFAEYDELTLSNI